MIPHDPLIAKHMIRGMAAGPKVLVKTANPCPECGQSLHFTEKGVVHMDPPRKRVKCLSCEYRGFVPYNFDQENVLTIKMEQDEETGR